MAGRSDAKIMFDLCSDTESAKTIKALREVVDSLSARLRTGGLRSQHAVSDVQALKKQIRKLESEVNGLHDDLAAPSRTRAHNITNTPWSRRRLWRYQYRLNTRPL